MQKETVIQGYRISPQQKRLWLLQQSTKSLAFRSQVAILIEGQTDTMALKQALKIVIARNEILRTTFHRPYGLTVPIQVIASGETWSNSEHDLCDLEREQQREQIQAILLKDARAPLHYEGGFLGFISFIRLSAHELLLGITLPSLCADSIALVNIVREFVDSYAALASSEQLPEATVQYVSASEWVNDLIESEDYEVGKEFWAKRIPRGLSDVALPFARDRSIGEAFEPECIGTVISSNETLKTQAVASRSGGSMRAFLLACWSVLLARLTGQMRSLIGVMFDGRNDEMMSSSLGLFARYLPIQPILDDSMRFTDLSRQMYGAINEIEGWQDWFTWDQIEGLAFDEIDNLFFPLCFDYEEHPEDSYHVAGTTFKISSRHACVDRFELRLRCVLSGENIAVNIYYNASLYANAEIALLLGRFLALIRNSCSDPESPISDLNLLTERERERLLVDFNTARTDVQHGCCIHQLFEEQVERTPDAIAVAYGDGCLTYADLNRRANQLSRLLCREGVKGEDLVPICLDRSMEMVMSLIGVMKAGAAYVPIDPGYPLERLAFMLEDTKSQLLVTQSKFVKDLPAKKVKHICLDADWDGICAEDDRNLHNRGLPNGLAYMIYTSGSTGKPKGVMVEHRSPISLLAALGHAIQAGISGPRLVASLNAPIAFDASVQQLVLLLQGHTLRIIPQDIRTDGESLLAYLVATAVDVFDCTPSQLEILLRAGLVDGDLPTPAILLVAGEAIERGVWETLARAHRPRFYNIYGPTECSVDATFCLVNGSTDRPNIGKPLANYRTYLLDSQMRPVPVGAKGELYIGGSGVARGYLRQSQLTAERFTPDPYSIDGARLYKTGDIGRYMLDGRIEFLGRTDGQVKIRGHRIELGEIESSLAEHPLLRQCIVVVREDQPGDKRIVAYVVAAESASPSSADLRAFLRTKLPGHMVPSAFVYLAELPLTTSGKLDRRALPPPEAASNAGAIAPRDTTELHLFQIWSDILLTENFGVRDNFFDLGGHSLTAVSLSSRLGEVYGEKISVRTAFDHPTIEQMASYLRQEVAYVPASPLVPIQKRGTRNPFFCVHPAGGVAHIFIPLARYLGPDQPFYALQSFDLDAEHLRLSTIEDMAARYLAEIRRIRSAGPYQLGGYSSGAVVAYEIAQQLHKAGERVSLLAVLDASLPQQVPDEPLTREELQAELRHLLINHVVSKLGIPIEEAGSMSISNLLQLTLSREKDAAPDGLGASIMMEITEEQILQFFINRVANTHAARRYTPKPYAGRITLFRGTNDREHDYGWGRWAQGGVEVYYLDADHNEFLRDQKAPVLASMLAVCLGANGRFNQ
jgi:amino acid adenylation domain-containing protein